MSKSSKKHIQRRIEQEIELKRLIKEAVYGDYKFTGIFKGRGKRGSGEATQTHISIIPPGTEHVFPLPKKYAAASYLTSAAGPRPRPKAGASELHKGRDYGAPGGEPILAYADGIAVYKANAGNAGNMITIKHSKIYQEITYGSEAAGGDAGKTYRGKLYTQYMHLTAPDKSIFKSKKVKAGQVIGYVGTTGNSTGNHLHFTFKFGINHQVHDDTQYDELLGTATKIDGFITEEHEDWETHAERVFHDDDEDIFSSKDDDIDPDSGISSSDDLCGPGFVDDGDSCEPIDDSAGEDLILDDGDEEDV